MGFTRPWFATGSPCEGKDLQTSFVGWLRQRLFVNVAVSVLDFVTFQEQAFLPTLQIAPSQLTLPKADEMLCCPWLPIPGEDNIITSPSHSSWFKTGSE